MRSILLTALSFALTAAQAPADSTIFVALSKGPSSISQVSVATGKIITSIPTGPGGATMAVTPNGQQAYVLSPELLELNSTGNNTIAVVNLQTGKIAATLSLTATPSLIAFDPAGEHAYVVATDAENNLKLIAIKTQTATIDAEQSYPQPGPNYPQGQIAISTDGSYLYYPVENGVEVFAVPSLRQVTTIPQSANSSIAGVVATDQYLVVGQLSAQVVNIYSAQTYDLVAAVPAQPVSAFALSPDGSSVYLVDVHSQSGQVSYTFDTLNLNSLQLTEGVTTPYGDFPIAISPNGSTALLGNSLVDLASQTIVTTLNTLTTAAAGQFSPSGNSIFVLNGFSSSLAVIDQASASVTGIIPVGAKPVWISPLDSNKELLVANQQSGNLTIEDASGGQLVSNLIVSPELYGQSLTFAAETDGVIYFTSSEAIGYYTIATGKFTSLLTETSGDDLTIVNFAQMNPTKSELFVDTYDLDCPECDSRRSANSSGSLLIYDTATGVYAGGLPLSPNGGITFNATGTAAYISTFSGSGSIPSITVFDTQTNQVKNVWLLPGAGTLWSMAVSPDGSTLYALDSSKNVIRIFDTASGKQTGTYSVTISSKWLALSPDGTQLYLVDPASTSVLVFNTSTGATNAILMDSPGVFVTAVP